MSNEFTPNPNLPAPDQSMLNELVRTLYGDLHRIAAFRLRSERSEHTLQTTALLHEAFIKLSESEKCRFNDANHFLAVASRVMRHVLVDYARSQSTKKRGHANVHAGVSPNLQVAAKSGVGPLDVLELDRALDALAQEDQSLAQLVELRYFGGMTAQETAEALGRSVHAVRHELRLAQAWLRRRIASD